MSDYDPPEKLIATQRELDAAYQRYRELLASLPPASAIVAGEAAITDEQHAALTEARAGLHRLLGALYDRDEPWFGGTGNEHAAREALKKAARA
jgi:hypothetical protein